MYYEGREVIDRPISVSDFMGTVRRILGIDYKKENITPNGRPIRIDDKREQLIDTLF